MLVCVKKNIENVILTPLFYSYLTLPTCLYFKPLFTRAYLEAIELGVS